MVQPVFAGNLITNQNFLSITEDPDRYKDVWVKVSGTIANTQDFGDSDAYIFTVGGVDSSKNQMGIWNEKGGIKFDRGDCVVIEGALEGSSTLESAFGAEFDVPYMWIGKQTKVVCPLQDIKELKVFFDPLNKEAAHKYIINAPCRLR